MTDCCEIDTITFGILSPEEIKSMAVCMVNKPGLSGPETIYDKAMGFMPGTNESCTTCGQKKDCWGHFGYIQLNEPVLHPMFQKLVVSFLKCFCKSCYRLLITKEQIELADLSNLKKERRFLKILEKLEKFDMCSHCGSLQPKILYKSKENAIHMEHKKKNSDGSKVSLVMSVEDIQKIFDNILLEDIELLGLDSKDIHPKNLILTHLPVIPPCSRPFIMADGNICDDDLTYQYIEIIKANNILSNSEENTKKPSVDKRQQIINMCKFRIATLMNNSKGQAKHPTDSRPLKCIKSRLGGKQGRLRGNLMGKRVNFSGRTVIGAAPHLKLDEFGVPSAIAKVHTFPESVNKYNIKWLQSLVDTGKANFIFQRKKDGSMIKIDLKYACVKKGTEIKFGDTIVRDYKGNLPTSDGGYVNLSNLDYNSEEIKETRSEKLNIGDMVYRKGKNISVKEEKKYKLLPGDILYRKSSHKIIHVFDTITNIEPGDIVIREGKQIQVEYPERRAVLLKEGDIVERHLMNGDYIIANRCPTLHRGSMMGFKIVIGDHKTFCFNLAACKSFNADFDGDEMNIHIPQSYETRAEIKLLATTKKHIISCQESKPNIVIVQDSLLGAYLMTKEDFTLSEEQFMDACAKGERMDGTPLLNTDRLEFISKKLSEYGQVEFLNGKGLISLMLPEDFFYEFKNDASLTDPIVRIENGVLISGVFDKKILGSAHSSLILILHKEYGIEVVSNFINNIQFVTNAWLMIHGFSIGLEDCLVTSEESLDVIQDSLYRCYAKAQGIEESTQNPGIREIRVTAALSQARDIGMKIAKEAMKSDNNFLSTVYSGSKGDFFNIAQITSLLGQQNLEGKRVTPQLNNGIRTLPHYPFEPMNREREYESRGFIRHSFIRGLEPQEFFFHAMSGREGICDTAMSTAKSGYIQRKIVKACEDVQIQYDNTVRDTTGKIYQFFYGDNNYNPTKTIRVSGKPQVCDVKSIAHKLNLDYLSSPERFFDSIKEEEEKEEEESIMENEEEVLEEKEEVSEEEDEKEEEVLEEENKVRENDDKEEEENEENEEENEFSDEEFEFDEYFDDDEDDVQEVEDDTGGDESYEDYE